MIDPENRLEADRMARAYGFEVGKSGNLPMIFKTLSHDNPFLDPKWQVHISTEESAPIFEQTIPLLLDLNMRESIGWARGFKKPDGTIRITIDLQPDASKQFADLTEIFRLYALGFAGIKRSS